MPWRILTPELTKKEAYHEPVNEGKDVEYFGGELGLGGAYEWAEEKYAIHGEALGQPSFEGSYGIKGTAGFSASF